LDHTTRGGFMKKALLILTILGVIALIAWKMMEETE
jgi:hypothetical protein